MPAGRPNADRQLAVCREEGLSCQQCVRNSAAHLVQIAADLSPAAASHLFQSLYPDRACLPMAGVFLQAMVEHRPARRPAARVTDLRYSAAVA
jgi:hypothetical protein